MPPKLGILAGRGEIPFRLVEACRQSGRDLFILAFHGETEPALVEGVPHAWVDLAAVGQALERLREAGCQELCLIGNVARPDFAKLRPDWGGVKLLPRLLPAVARGEGALLSVLLEFLGEQGFRTVGAEEVLQTLAAPAGPFGRHAPAAEDWPDIRRGIEVARGIGRLDVGQAVVVRGGLVLAVEAAEGTDAMLGRCRPPADGGAAGVLVKLPKPQQERRVDLPTVGLATVEGVAAAGLRGLAVEAGGALVVGREAMAARADALGLFLYGLGAGELA